MTDLFDNEFFKEGLLGMLKDSVISEQVAGNFYEYIAGKIKNGKARNRFKKFAEIDAQKHKNLLINRIKVITGKDFVPDLTALDAKIGVYSFSLIGALDMAKESERRAIDFYKIMRKRDKEYKKMYEGIIKEEKKHWSAIDEEKRIIKDKGFYEDADGIRLFSLLGQTWK